MLFILVLCILFTGIAVANANASPSDRPDLLAQHPIISSGAPCHDQTPFSGILDVCPGANDPAFHCNVTGHFFDTKLIEGYTKFYDDAGRFRSVLVHGPCCPNGKGRLQVQVTCDFTHAGRCDDVSLIDPAKADSAESSDLAVAVDKLEREKDYDGLTTGLEESTGAVASEGGLTPTTTTTASVTSYWVTSTLPRPSMAHSSLVDATSTSMGPASLTTSAADSDQHTLGGLAFTAAVVTVIVAML